MSDNLLQPHQTPIVRKYLTDTFLMAFEVSRGFQKSFNRVNNTWVHDEELVRLGKTIGMLQDTAVRARPSGLACRSVLRLSGKIMQIRTSLARRLRSRLFFIVVTCFGKQMCKIRERPCAAFQALLAADRLPNVRRHAFQQQLQGYECPGRLAREVWCGLFPKRPQGGRNARPTRTPMSGTTAAPPLQSSGELWRRSCNRKRAATIYQAVQRYNLVVNKA